MTGLALLGGSLLAHAQVVPPELSADEPIEFDAENNRMTARGNAILDNDDMRVRADRIVFEQDESTVKAKKEVSIKSGNFRLLTDNAEYDYFNRTFYADDFRLGNDSVYVLGKQAQGDKDNVEVDNARIYIQEPDMFALNLNADKLTLVNQETVAMDDVVFRIGEVPFFYLPYVEYDVQDGSPVQYTGNIGQQNDLGFYWQNAIAFRFIPELAAGLNIDGYTKRGVLAGPILDYNWSDPDLGSMSGWLDTGYIHDEGSPSELGTDVLGRPIQPDRWFIEWRHKQYALEDESLEITASLSWWSDSYVERDFREGLYEDNQQPDSFLETTYRGENWYLDAIARVQPNNFQTVAQRLPEIRFDLMPTEIFETGAYQRLDVSYATLQENSPTGAFQTLESNRVNAYYGLTYPIAATDWMTITPVAGVMATHYAVTLGNNGSYTRVLGEFGVDVDLSAVGVWDYQNEFWEIDGLRHFLQPTIQYRYIPGAQAGDTEIPPIDRLASFDTYLEPIGLANKRNIDDLYEENAIRVGVQNIFQTRDPEYGSRDLLEVDLYQEFRFATRPAQPARFGQSATPAQQDYSDTYLVIDFSPAYWVNFGALFRIDPNKLNLDEVTTGVRFTDGEEWTVFFGNDYVTDVSGVSGGVINQFVVDARYRLDSRNQLGAYWSIDARLGELTEQTYLWETMLGNSWEATFAIIHTSGSSRQNGFKFQVSVSLVRI
ncbi:LPS assembly protein LptD [Ruficoccus sp. ZRK36]|uniref:LPS-assembly protein LptD n=1 Tax=Ruficoccus sp. ZRK36 TaxID=2866311 RepID=UPI001C7372FA|nr:LPS assembly protein LptD [Ruficoccus sp. ZRK36]QYY35548.1 LPS assembly protein LptD [Ruficoccus sp. ZRK36]